MNQPSVPSRRVDASRRVLFTGDTCSFFYDAELLCPDGPPYGRTLIDRHVARLKVNGVDTFLVNPNAQTVWYPSRTLQTVLDGYKRGDREYFRGHGEGLKITGEKLDQYLDHCVKFYNNYLDLIEEGTDWLRETSAACRRHGVMPWLSVRMNDQHGADNPAGSFMNWKGFADPKLRLRGNRLNPARGQRVYWQALNYECVEVRDYMLAMIRECVNDYDYEGLELDWLRNPNCCEPGATAETIRMMTAWIAEIRALTQARAKATGRPYPLGLRLPPSLAYLKEIGLDVAGLVQAGLVDFVGFSNFWQTSWDMPYERLRKQLGDEVTIYGIIEDAPNWVPAVMPGRPLDAEIRNPGMRYLSASAPLLRANAAGKLATGADGIYLFNFHCTNEHKDNGLVADYAALRQIADATALRGREKHYALATPGVNAPHWDVPCQLPAIIETGYRREFSLAMAAEPAAGGLRGYVQLVYDRRDGVPPLGVSINGALPSFAGKPVRHYVLPVGKYAGVADAHESLLFEFDPAAITEGWNTFTIHNDELNPETLAPDKTGAVRLLSLEVFLVRASA